MKETVAFILMIIGVALAGISGFISFFKALSDPDVDKVTMYFGFYIFKYPNYLLASIIGGILMFISSVLISN